MGRNAPDARFAGLWVMMIAVFVSVLLVAALVPGGQSTGSLTTESASAVSGGHADVATSEPMGAAATLDASTMTLRRMNLATSPAMVVAGGGGLPEPRGDAGAEPLDDPFQPATALAEGAETQQGVAMDVSATGRVFVAYENETSPGNFDIYVAYSDDGGQTWTHVAVPEPEAGMSERNPSISVTPTVVNVFFEQYTYDQRFYLAQSTNNGATYTTTAFNLAGSTLNEFRNPDVVSFGSWSWVAWDIYDGYVSMGTPIDVRTVTWWWSDDDWASTTGTLWICHSSVPDDRASPPCSAPQSEDWTQPNIAVNATTASYADPPLDFPAAGINQFFQVDQAFLASGDGSESLYFLYYDFAQDAFFFFPTWIWNALFGFPATPEYGGDLVAAPEGWYMPWTWDLGPLGLENWTVGMSYDDATFFFNFVGVPATAASNYTYPKLSYSNGVLWGTFFNATSAGTDVYFVFSLDFGDTWSQEYRVNANTPGTASEGLRQLTIAGTTDEPFICWTDTRAGDPDVYCSSFGPFSIYVITKSPADPGLLATGVQVNGTFFAPAPTAFIWPWGSNQNVSVNLTEQSSPDTRYIFSDWSDGGAINHTITITPGTKFLQANYSAQYLLTMSANFGTVTPGTGWYNQSDIVVIEAFAPPPTWAWGERYNWNGWLGSSACGAEFTGPGVGPAHTAQVTMNCPITEQASWNHQFYLEVNSPYATTTGTGWYSAGFTVPFSVTPTTVTIGPDERVAFSFWSGQGNGSYDGTNNPWTVTLNAPIIETAVWDTEYRLTVSTNFGTVDPPGGWFKAGTSVNISALPPASVLGERYVWNGWTGTVSSMLNPVTVVINGPTTETADWIHEYYLTVQSPYGIPSGEGWYAAGASATAGLNTGTVGGPDTRWVFAQWGGDATGANFAASNPILMDAPKTAAAQWTTQHYLTVTSPYGTTSGEGWYDEGTNAVAGLDVGLVSGGPDTQFVFVRWGGAATGTAFAASDPVLMNGPKTAIAEWKTQYWLDVSATAGTVSPPSGWYDAGTVLNLVATPPNLVYPTGERYVFNGWTGTVTSPNNPVQVTMSGPVTMTADWVHEFYLTVTSPYGTSSGFGWFAEGANAVAGLDTDTVGAQPTRWVFAQWGGDATGTDFAASDPILMDAPKTAAAQWTAQHWLTVTTSYATPSGAGWYDEGTDAFAGLDTNLVPGGLGTRFLFVQWTKDASGTDSAQSDPITMNGPREAVAQWVTQYQLTISSNVGTVVPATGAWFNAGSSVVVSTVTPNPVAGERYSFLGWTGAGAGSYTGTANPATITMLGPITQTAQWDHEYFLTVTSFTGAPTGQGWYDAGAVATFSVTTPASGGTGVRHAFLAWTGDSSSTSPSDTLPMDAPKSVEATWQTQYLLTVVTAQSTGSCDLTDCWYDAGAAATASVASAQEPDPVESGTRYDFRGWGGAATGTGTTSDPIVMNGPSTAVAQWVTQYELRVHALYQGAELLGVPVSVDGIAGPTTITSIWLDAGTTHLIEVTTPYESGGQRHAFSAWTTGAQTPAIGVSLTAATDLTAQYVPATGVLTGTVRAEGDGAPVPGATVTAGTVQGSTASDGTYQLTVPDGTYTVTVSHGDYETATRDGVVVGIGETVGLDFLLELSADTDADGLPDTWERSHFGNLNQEAQGDPDGDGFTNLDEWRRGTDPNGRDFLPEFWWLWLVLFLLFLIAVLILVVAGRRRGRPEAEVYEELYGVPPATEEVVVKERKVKKPKLPPPPEEEAEEAAEEEAPAKAAALPECPNCGLINEPGATECAVCGAAMGAAALSTDDRMARLEDALKEGRITQEQYEANLKKLQGE